MVFRNKIRQRYFDPLRLHLRLVRALQRADRYPKCFTHSSCASRQIGFYQVLNRVLQLHLEVVQWTKVGVYKMKQKTTPN